MSISNTIGTDSRNMARSILPDVYSVSVPEMACLKREKNHLSFPFMGRQK
jgi:hypothetical protein